MSYTSSPKATTSSLSSSTTASEQEIATLASRLHIDIFQKGRLYLVNEILTPDFVLHNHVLPSF
jgi:hypothetical protein